MFNSDIRRAFLQTNTNPTPEFTARLRAQILPKAPVKSTPRPWRVLAFSGATLLVLMGLNAMINPKNVNHVFAQAIQQTFSFSSEGFHHITIAFEMHGLYNERTWTDELWNDGAHAITETTQSGNTPYDWGSSYYDVPNNVMCGIGMAQARETCNTFESTNSWGRFINPEPAKTMNIKSISIERANDTHGDLYFTWITPQPISGVTYIDTSVGPYGYEFGTWNGTYSWKNSSGESVNRVTWFSENMTQSAFDEQTHSFVVQIQEIAPEDVGSAGAYEGTYRSQSPVFLVDLDSMTVTPVTDEWLEQTRKDFDAKHIKQQASSDTLVQEYEQAFRYALDIGENLSNYNLISQHSTETTEVATYDLGHADPIIIDAIPAERVEFTREIASNLIREVSLYGADDTRIYHAEVLTFEQSTVAPEGFFSQQAWMDLVSKHR